MPNAILKLLVKGQAALQRKKYVKEGEQNLRGERNEVTADERQTGS